MFRKAIQIALLEGLGDQIKKRQWEQIYLGRSLNYSFKATSQGTHVNPWLIHVNIWQKPLQYFKVISLQLIKINEKIKKKKKTSQLKH